MERIMRGRIAVLVAAVALAAVADMREVVSWKGSALAAWNRTHDARDLSHADGGLSFVTTGADPQLYCEKCDFMSATSQTLRFRVRTTAGGKTEVFWATEDAPRLMQYRSCNFEIVGDGQWRTYEVRPFWPAGKRVIKLRFDTPQTAPVGTKVEVEEISVCDSPSGMEPVDADKFTGVTFRYATTEKRYVTLAWTTDKTETMCRHEFRTVPDGREHTYWFDLSLGVNSGIGYWYRKEWKGKVGWFGVMDMRRGRALDVKDLKFVSSPPDLPADVEVESARQVDGIVRVGYETGIELSLRNLGTVPARKATLELDAVPDGLEFPGGKTFALGTVPASTGYDSIGGRLPNQVVTTVPFMARKVGEYVLRGRVAYASEGSSPVLRHVPVECRVEVKPSLNLPRANYVPEPKPIKTRCEVGAISFPGWCDQSWDRIRNFTPERKPLLGWYDESSPEVMDWQIKWLVENGISYLIVDWYPRKERVTGRFKYNNSHWITAFRKARYRRFIKWAVLWENMMDGHDVPFVEWIAKELAEECFSMPEYYRIDGRPVVFVWDWGRLERNLEKDGGCRRALEIIRAAAQAKGHKGVWFISHRSQAVSRKELEKCRAAGFDMTALYHYRGDGAPGVANPVEGRRPFADIVKTSLPHWRALHKAGVLPFLPSLTTGWDDRPWNGDHGLEIYGRTPETFGAICRDAATFAAESGVTNMLVGPINEWGEGSYAEPNAEFGFGMYEAVRDAFGVKPAEGWPVNFTPKDVGLGPYPGKPVAKVEDRMWPTPLKDVKLGGAPGAKMDRFFTERIVSPEGREKVFGEARETFKTRDDDSSGIAGRWRGEFWGKEMLSSVRVAEYLDDPDLKTALRDECHWLMAFQDADGYLGSYSNKEFVVCTELEACMKRFGWYPNWNIWNRKYTIWGMYEAYRATGDRTILDSAVRQMDQLVAMMRRLKLRLHDVGTLRMNGLPPMSILKPLLLLYRETGKEEYLEFARDTVTDWDRTDGAAPNFLRNFCNGKPLWQWYPKPMHWAKSYEMMSCLEGLLEYYRLTGERRVLDAVAAIRDNIAENESNAIGGVGFCDKFYDAANRANAISEVCDSIHWMRLNYELFLLTGDIGCIDAIERTYLNAFLAGVYRDGSFGAFAVRAAQRHATQYQCGYKYNQCCVNNVPRGFMDVAEITVTRNIDRTLYVNFYQDATVEMDGVKFEISGNYPVGNHVKVKTTSAVNRLVRFRIPGFGVRPSRYENARIPVGEKVFDFHFDMPVRIVERRTGLDTVAPPYPAMHWYGMRYAVSAKPTPETQDIWDGYRATYAATLVLGPLVLAKAKRLGLSRDEIFPADTVNGKGYAVTLKPIPAKDTWGTWEVELSKPGEKAIRTRACDFQSAADESLPTGADAFSIWF